ncbi:MAG: tail fiber domain-containing protein [Acidobacteriota bacterium]
MPTSRRSTPTFLLAALALLGLTAAAWAAPPVAHTDLNAAGAVWQPATADYAAIDLTLTGPNDFYTEKTFPAGAFVGINLGELDAVVDGVYTYELVVRPTVDADALEAARAAGATPASVATRKVQSGSFRVLNGAIVTPAAAEGPAGGPVKDLDVPTEDQVVVDDQIVQGSSCVGLDCVNGESFGFDTIRLKENNLRIHFNDTSNSASFPSNDWRIVANDTTNGGGNYLAFEDSTAGRQPFRVDAGAPANALRVDSGGDVGIGTATPVVQVHVVDGNTPTLRLEQDGSSGFTPQTWDVAGNEAGFFIRDATNGSRLAFRIRPGAPESSIDIAPDGDVGIGTGSPSSSMHVRRTNGTANVLIEDTSSTPGGALEVLTLERNGRVRMGMENTSITGNPGTKWVYDVNNAGNFAIIDLSDLTTEFSLNNNGNLIISGTLTEMSDRNQKTSIEAVDPSQVLDSVLTLPISTWTYIKGDPEVQHLGPMAQDFHALFGLGEGETSIATIDVAGVALAAIQGLDEKVQAKDAEIEQLNDRIEALEALVRELAARDAN